MGALGRIYITERMRVMLFFLLFLPAPGAVWAVDSTAESCPLGAHRYSAQLTFSDMNATVGEAVMLHFSLDPPTPPPGFFLSVNMNGLQTPAAGEQNPDILTGFPDTRLVFHAPGFYRYRVVVSLIAKSSCGGVKADTVFKGEARINVNP